MIAAFLRPASRTRRLRPRSCDACRRRSPRVVVGEGAASLEIMQLDEKTRQTTRLAGVFAGPSDPDLAWTPEGMLLMAHNEKLYGWRQGQPEPTVVGDLEGLRGARRLPACGQPARRSNSDRAQP
jgi:hypothetical protein